MRRLDPPENSLVTDYQGILHWRDATKTVLKWA